MGWAAEFNQRRYWAELLTYLAAQPWPRPETVQVLIHDEEDDCFGLWMLRHGTFAEVPLPDTRRESYRHSADGEYTTLIRAAS